MEDGPTAHLRHLLLPYPATAVPEAWQLSFHQGDQLRVKRSDLPSKPLQTLSEAGKPAGLFSLVLPSLHARIIELLWLHPFLTCAQIAAFLDVKAGTIQKALVTLSRIGCVEAEVLLKEERFRLASAGLRWLALRHRLSIRTLAVRHQTQTRTVYMQRGLDPLRRDAERTVGIAAFFAKLARNETHPRDRLLWWETAPVPEQSSYSYAQDAWKHLHVDAIAEYQAGEQRRRFCLEYLSKWNQAQTLKAHLESYAAHVRSGEWQREGQVLPMLLLVCLDGAQEHQIQQIVQAILTKQLVVLSTRLDALHESGPLAPIWQRLSSEQSAPRRRLYELHE